MFRLPRKLKKQWKKTYRGMLYQTWKIMASNKNFEKKYQKELQEMFNTFASVRDTGESIQGTHNE